MKLSACLLPLLLGCAPDLFILSPGSSDVSIPSDAAVDGGAPDTALLPEVGVDVPADTVDGGHSEDSSLPPDVQVFPDVTLPLGDVAQDAQTPTDTPDVFDTPEVQDTPDVFDSVDAADTPDAVDVRDASDTPDVSVAPMDLGPPPCLPGQDRCGGVMCLNLGTDINNCGGCGNACPSRPNAPAACNGGSCSLVCAPGHLNCDGNLTNGCETTPATDAQNCGGCGRTCQSLPNTLPSLCVAGSCSFGCGTGYANCDGLVANGCEVSTSTDPMNCGACGRACGAGQTCDNGACFCTFTGRPACDGSCPNYLSDRNNCGACGNVCGTGQGCCDGVCSDPMADRFNCGRCGTRCPGGSTCVSGACACPGGSRQIICGNACVTPATDPRNCGWCGRVCSGSASRCVQGQCTV